MLLFKTSLFFAHRTVQKNSKLKITAPTWNDEFELPDGSYSMTEIKIISSTS